MTNGCCRDVRTELVRGLRQQSITSISILIYPMLPSITIEDRQSWSIASFYRHFLWLPVVFIGMFFVSPIIVVVVRSFVDPAPGTGNYVDIFLSATYLCVLANTMGTALIVTSLSLLIAYPLAYVMTKAHGSVLAIMTSLVVVSLWTSVVIRSYAWMVIFQRRGVLNGLLTSTGLSDSAINFLPGTLAVNVGMVHIMLPFMVLPLLSNMRSIDKSLIAAAGVLGANPWHSFRKVFLPLSLPGVSAGSALVFMMSLGFFVTPALLGGPQHLMAAVLIEQQANRMLNWGMASALATVLLVFTVLLYLMYLRVMRYAEGARKHAG